MGMGISTGFEKRIIDYIKGFGNRGKLPSVAGRLDDYYKGYLRQAYDWACESVDGANRDGFPYFVRNFNLIAHNDFTFNKRGLIYVERSIDLDVSNGFDDLSFKSVGECWSWKRKNSSSYCANFSLLNNSVVNVVLCGYVHPESIDWLETIYLNSYDMKNETEIRMNDNAVVEVSYIRIGGRVFRLGGSYLLDASAHKYNKAENGGITEVRLHNIISESLHHILLEGNDNYEIYYRGYNSKYGSNHNHLLWITDDIEYARVYGNRVEEIVIDNDKLNLASLYDIDETVGYVFDYIDGLSEEEVQLLMDEGYNGYGFNVGDFESYCICLFDPSCIVSRRELSRDEFDRIEMYDDEEYRDYDEDYD